MNSNRLKAFCWGSGLLQVARDVPEGALHLATGPDEIMLEAISGTARLGYDNQTWIVPGVPEANSTDAALDAVFDFQNHLVKRIGSILAERGGRHVRTAPRI